MKQILTIIFLFSCVLSQAQPYQSMFGENSTEWYMWVNGPTSLHADYTAKFEVQKDTVVDGKVYKKISTGLGADYHDFLLREDLDSGKVWYRQLLTSYKLTTDCIFSDILFMDYNLEVGDSFRRGPASYSRYDTVESVYIENGRKHIRLGIDVLLGERVEMIEGVGITAGFARGFLVPCDSWPDKSEIYMLCANHDGLSIHHNKSFGGNCTPFPKLAVDDIPKANSPFTIFPVPVQDKLNIIFSRAGSVNVPFKIFNNMGQLVYNGIIKAGANRTTIDLKELPSGLYNLNIINLESQPFTKQ